MVIPFIALIAFAAYYYYWSTQQFEVTGQVLFKNALGVQPVRGANVEVYDASVKPHLGVTRYALLLVRQSDLQMDPDSFKNGQGRESEKKLIPLNLAPLSAMNWTWWEVQRLRNCSYAAQVFQETLVNPAIIASTSTDMDGRYWLNLKRGKYFITVDSEVPTFFRLNDPALSADTADTVDGHAFWNVPVSVSGNMKLVSAKPDCDPGP